MKVEFIDEIDSTNSELLKRALNNPEMEDEALVAYKQTMGKGRRGRSFFSPENTGIYISILLHPDCYVNEATLVTTTMAVAAARALEKNDSNEVYIKWVNDLYVEGKKVGGILTECSPEIADGKPKYLVVGIGINLFTPKDDFPDDIKDKAGSVYNKEFEKNITDNKSFRQKIAKLIIDEFLELYGGCPNNSHLDEYRERSFIIGKEVMIVDDDIVTVLGIQDDFGLSVKYKNGIVRNLTAGEVSLLL